MSVQIDQYQVSEPELNQYYLGIDVGSTSTKAVLVNTLGEPFAGFYTYTTGQPLKAVQAIFEAMDHFMSGRQIKPRIVACGTTGSGRKFIGGIIRADQDIDEITAHARAAFELNPHTDTIIESVESTGRLVVLDEATPRCNIATDISALVCQEAFDSLKAPIRMVTAPHTPVPFADNLEDLYIPGVDQVTEAVRAVAGHG